MHAMYRGKFNVVDLFNKASCQPGTLQDTWRTKKVHKRLFAASISWIETNASLAFAKYNPTVTLTKREWYETLSEACLNNPFAPCRPRTMPTPPRHEGITQGGGGTCRVCGKKSQWKCACGRAVCGPCTRARVTGGVKPPARLCWKGHMDV